MKNLIPWRRRNRQVAPLQHDFDDLVDRFFGESLAPMRSLFSEDFWYPTVDVSENRKNIIVKAEIPGVELKDIDVSLDGRLLTIKGEKKQEKEESDEHYHRLESSYGYYRRTIELPADVDPANVDAKYKNGVLKIKLKKVREAETRTIKIKTA